MIRIPPEEMHILTESEVTNFGLKGLDPVEEEIQDSAGAKKYSISKKEYLRRKKLSHTLCNDILQNAQFKEATKCYARVYRQGM